MSTQPILKKSTNLHLTFILFAIIIFCANMYRDDLPYFPPELWIIILKMLHKFSDIVSAIRAKRRFRMLQDVPKIFLNLYVI